MDFQQLQCEIRANEFPCSYLIILTFLLPRDSHSIWQRLRFPHSFQTWIRSTTWPLRGLPFLALIIWHWSARYQELCHTQEDNVIRLPAKFIKGYIITLQKPEAQESDAKCSKGRYYLFFLTGIAMSNKSVKQPVQFNPSQFHVG